MGERGAFFLNTPLWRGERGDDEIKTQGQADKNEYINKAGFRSHGSNIMIIKHMS